MIEREKIPNRRMHETRDIEFQGHEFVASFGFLPGPGARVIEVFCHGMKEGSAIQQTLNDACIMTGIMLQLGFDAQELSQHCGMLCAEGEDYGPSASIIGHLLRISEDVDQGLEEDYGTDYQ